eukprot:11879515-Alexandrium_andersonii.AAC.1
MPKCRPAEIKSGQPDGVHHSTGRVQRSPAEPSGAQQSPAEVSGAQGSSPELSVAQRISKQFNGA